jgi:hypothetical protein
MAYLALNVYKCIKDLFITDKLFSLYLTKLSTHVLFATEYVEL